MTETRGAATRQQILEASRQVLLEGGFAGLSTRRIAELGGTQMSQIRYHFGSKEGLVLALFEDMNAELLIRQESLFSAPEVSVAERWDLACDYLEQDLESGYVRVLQELIAAGWADPSINSAVRRGLAGWNELLCSLARDAEAQLGSLAPFTSEEFAALIAASFLGAEAQILLGIPESDVPIRGALRRVGDLLRTLADSPTKTGA